MVEDFLFTLTHRQGVLSLSRRKAPQPCVFATTSADSKASSSYVTWAHTKSMITNLDTSYTEGNKSLDWTEAAKFLFDALSFMMFVFDNSAWLVCLLTRMAVLNRNVSPKEQLAPNDSVWGDRDRQPRVLHQRQAREQQLQQLWVWQLHRHKLLRFWRRRPGRVLGVLPTIPSPGGSSRGILAAKDGLISITAHRILL